MVFSRLKTLSNRLHLVLIALVFVFSSCGSGALEESDTENDEFDSWPNGNAGISTSASSASTTEFGTQGEFTVELAIEPTSTVTLTITGDATEGTISPSSLTFDSSNWDSPQTVTVTGIEDNTYDGTIVYNVSINASASDFYDDMNASVSISNLERFVSHDTYVEDRKNSLHWQVYSTPLTNASNGTNDNDATTFCDDLEQGTFDDWRLPTGDELLTLKDSTANSAPFINENFFSDMGTTGDESGFYRFWTSEEGSTSNSRISVNFSNSSSATGSNSNADTRSFFVRCVRDI